MKINELLNESVSISVLSRRLHREILDTLPKMIASRYNKFGSGLALKQYLIDPDYEETPADRNSDISTIKNWIVTDLKSVIGKFLKEYYPQYSKLTITFAAGHGGSYNHTTKTIYINSSYINSIAKEFYNALTSIVDANKKVSTLDVDIVANVVSIIKFFAHELVHHIQWSSSAIEDPYRSYTLTDKAKFQEKMNQDVLDLDYYSSPEEIAAYAHGNATQMLSDMDYYPDGDQIEMVTDMMQYITTRGSDYSQFDNQSPRIKKLVINRYLKKLYQELDSYRTHLIQQSKQ